MRHVDAGYEDARSAAAARDLAVPGQGP
jgi:hypothetical protein